MPPLVLLPDVEHLTLEYLRTVPELVALLPDGLSTALPSPLPARYLTLIRLGGAQTSAPGWVDSARLQIDSWATTRGDASLVIRTARAALRASGNYRTARGLLCGARVVLEPAWRPDASRTPPTPRFSMTVDMGAHP